MKVLLFLLLLLAFIPLNSASAEEACPPGQKTFLIQTGLMIDMIWIGFEQGQDKGVFKPFQSPVSEATICHMAKQSIHIQEAVTHHWYKLIYRNGTLTELESLD